MALTALEVSFLIVVLENDVVTMQTAAKDETLPAVYRERFRLYVVALESIIAKMHVCMESPP